MCKERGPVQIELDDSSHMLPEREERDGFVDSILNRIVIKVIHVPVARNYNLELIFNTIK